MNNGNFVNKKKFSIALCVSKNLYIFMSQDESHSWNKVLVKHFDYEFLLFLFKRIFLYNLCSLVNRRVFVGVHALLQQSKKC